MRIEGHVSCGVFPMQHTVRRFLAAFIAVSLLAAGISLDAAEDVPTEQVERIAHGLPIPLPAITLAAIRRCREQIVRLQLADGAFRFTTEAGDRVRIVPYFGNVAARCCWWPTASNRRKTTCGVSSGGSTGMRTTRREDGTILDFIGNGESYTPSPSRDSIDTYPASYLATLWWFWKTCCRDPRSPRESVLLYARCARRDRAVD